jgi:glycosyltransferase involved in cell wall biosynthesis
MKVLHVCSFYRPFGGAEKLLFDVLKMLESRGVTTAVVAPASQAGYATNARAEHFVDFLEYPFSRTRLSTALRDNRRMMKSLRESILCERPDVIHLHNQQNPFVYMACLATGVPVVRNVHDPRLYCPTNWRLLPDRTLCPYPMGRACFQQGCVDCSPASIKHLAALLLGRHLSFQNTTFIIESIASYQLALQNGYSPESLCLIPNFTTLRPMDEELAFKARHHRPGGRNILFVGRASYEKGVEFLLRALAGVRSDFTLHLLTAGDYFTSTVAPLITRLGLTGRVQARLDTSYQETARYYSMADVVVVPSVWYETFCLVGIEAFAHLTPVVATRVGGIPDWCVDGETGRLVDAFDEGALGRAIEDLLDNPERARQFGVNGYNRVKALYGPELYYERLVGLYERAAGRGENPPHRLPGLAGRSLQPGAGLPGGGPEGDRARTGRPGPEQSPADDRGHRRGRARHAA